MLVATILLIGAGTAHASPDASAIVIRDVPVARPAPPDAMAVARQFTARRTRADCVGEALASSDLVVCAPLQDQALPVPEIYGPVPGSTDGAAVDPSGVPCGASISNDCYGSINLLVAIPIGIGILRLLIDPERNLGEGAAIPERFRGANR